MEGNNITIRLSIDIEIRINNQVIGTISLNYILQIPIYFHFLQILLNIKLMKTEALHDIMQSSSRYISRRHKLMIAL